MGASHPIAWARSVGAGRSWYTAMGHTMLTEQDYEESFFEAHLLGGIQFAAGVPEPGGIARYMAAALALLALRGWRPGRPHLLMPMR